MLPALAAVLALTGCGGEDSGGEGIARVKVGTGPVADAAPIPLAGEKRFFADARLEVEQKLAEGGAAILPAVVSGDFEFGSSNLVSLIIARAKGLPVKIVALSGSGGTGGHDNTDAVMVAKDSSIRRPRDLEGKTVAVNTLNNIGPLTVNAALEKEGVDYRKVRYIEVPFPEMNAALEAGRVDAAWIVEPFVTQGEAAGHRTVLLPFEATAPNLPINALFTTERYIAEQGDIVERFAKAIRRSVRYAADHPAAVRAVIPTYTKIERGVASEITLSKWDPKLDPGQLRLLIDLARKYGFIENGFPPEELLHESAN